MALASRMAIGGIKLPSARWISYTENQGHGALGARDRCGAIPERRRGSLAENMVGA
jgi:hypothetical protein